MSRAQLTTARVSAAGAVGLFLAALVAEPRSSAAEEEWRRSNPDVVVYLPKGGDHHDGDNEMLLVFPAPKSDGLIGMWTQSSVEGRGDNRIIRTANTTFWANSCLIHC
jgi:hypothetical protein